MPPARKAVTDIAHGHRPGYRRWKWFPSSLEGWDRSITLQFFKYIKKTHIFVFVNIV